ncbi:MAG: YjgN family protein [bacterium]
MKAHHFYHAHFDGSVGEYYPLFFRNLLLTLVTLGLYSAWAATDNRRYFFSHLEIAGSRYHYHGTGRELLVGRLKAFGILLAIALVCLWATFVLPEDYFFVIALCLYLLIFVMGPIAIIGMLRYRFSRTSWHNVRMSFTGDWREFLPIYVRGSLLSIISLGFYTPFFTIKALRYLLGNTALGNQRYGFDGDAIELMAIYLRGILFSILTLGIYYFWFLANYHGYVIDHITISGHRYLFNASGLDYLTLLVPQFALVFLTFGLALPIAYIQAAKFFAHHLYLENSFDPQSIRPASVQRVGATGDALHSVLGTT